MKRIYIIGALLFMFSPALASADDLYYASLTDLIGGNILLTYNTTHEGELYAVCDMDTAKCGELTKEKGDAFDLSSDMRAISPDGSRAVSRISSFGDIAYWALYEVNDSEVKFLSLLDHRGQASRVSITYANDVVVFRSSEGVLVREDIDSGERVRLETNRRSFPFYSISEHGRYASIYDESEKEHVVWDFDKGGSLAIDADIRSYIVYSDNEETLGFLREVDGFNKLFIARGDDFEDATEVHKGKDTVAEYEFIDNTLFFIANEVHSPLTWNLYRYDPRLDELEVVERGVAYDDAYLNLRKTSDRLFYQVVEGKTRMYVGYDPNTQERTVYNAAPETNVSEDISREEISVGGRNAVLLSPNDEDENKRLPLIVWLHGGPLRQVSIEYHPFFGYAVYDDVLERLAQSARVVKLDYTGSYGYGNAFAKALEGNIGISDAGDVMRGIEEFRESYKTGGVYLMGNSYGGYLSLKTLVETPENIDGAVSISGVTDWYGLVSRIPSSPFRKHFGGVPDNDTFDAYMDASIYSKLKDVDNDTPMILTYGGEDDLVPTWQSKEFEEFAHSLGKSVDLVAFEEEGHTIKKRENLNDLCMRTAHLIGVEDAPCDS